MVTFLALFIFTFMDSVRIGYMHLILLFSISRAYLDCHLMVTNPSDYVEAFGKAGASGFTFHIEVARGK